MKKCILNHICQALQVTVTCEVTVTFSTRKGDLPKPNKYTFQNSNVAAFSKFA